MTVEQTEGPVSPEAIHQALTREELMELGLAVIDSFALLDFEEAAMSQVESTGVANPNKVSKGIFFAGQEGKLPMKDEHAYRSVDIRAVHDLSASGVVRGAYSATGGKRSNTVGHSTFWSKGNPNSRLQFASPGHFILETPIGSTEKGWVKGNDLTGIYAKDKDGVIHNILEQSQ